MSRALIEKLSHDGRGLARIDGKTTFIQGALPGETVVFQLLKQKPTFDEALTLSVTIPSSHRVTPKCAHFGVCGGCALQHMDSEAQLHAKHELFLDIMERIGHCKPEALLSPLAAEHWHYRDKARLSVHVDPKTHQVSLGFREKNNPKKVVNIQQCPILNQQIEAHLPALCHLIASLSRPHTIAQVEVAAADDAIALIFRHLKSLSPSDEKKLIEFSKTTQFRLFLQAGGPATVRLFYPKDVPETLTYALPSESLSFLFHPTDFTQINAGLNRLMIPSALSLLELKPDDVVLDLFCGLGNFSLPIARWAAQVVGIEGSEHMVLRATQNAVHNGLHNAVFLSADLEKEAIFERLKTYRFTKLLLDPPRTGAYAFVQQIEKINPSRIVYVSCNPATLARDADVLVHQKGYHMLKAGVMDMFPQSAHVESMVVFEKQG